MSHATHGGDTPIRTSEDLNMSSAKWNGSIAWMYVGLPLLVMASSPALAGATTLICPMDNNYMTYEDEPTTIELNEAQSTVVVNFAARHLKNPRGVSGGADGRGGSNAFSTGPLSAKFSADTISFSWNYAGQDQTFSWAINRLTGSFGVVN